ncbi:MAG: triose-phosphate isomerase family protein, partial [Candidatus Levyibacteriota bacterium]
YIGAQDISPFASGAYTGEVNANQIKEFAQYAIIGHSERRKYFREDDEMLIKKVRMALAEGIIPIFCVASADTFIPEGVELVAYEPLFAIGSGKADTPEDAEEIARAIKEKNADVKTVIYGGSVNPENVHSFTSMPSVDGVLPGGASLDTQKFTQLITNA